MLSRKIEAVLLAADLMRAEVRARLEERSVQAESGCRLWTGALNGRGYGQLAVGGSSMSTHRLAWIAHLGPIPTGRLVCHHCDVRACVNPEHLFLGDAQDNASDMVRKGRQLAGERNPRAKLTDEQIDFIRERCAAGESRASVARRLGVSAGYVSSVALGQYRAITQSGGAR